MKNYLLKILLLIPCLCFFSYVAEAQKAKKRSSTKRANTTTRKTTKGKTKATISPVQVDTVASAAQVAAPAVAPLNDSMPIKKIRKSLRPDEAVETKDIRDRVPLAYEHLRVDDAIYRHKIWRDIDTREKINLPFRYSADENNGNQRFISILFQAIQDSLVTVFSPIDDRFTTPMTRAEVVTKIAGEPFQVAIVDSLGQTTYETKTRDIVLDSFTKFRIKEEVIFDKESSRLFWRILGIAPLYNVYSAQTNQLVGIDNEMFWVYYPDMRPVFARYEIYNGKNFGQRQSWEELFESRMFSGRIIKSTIDNPFNKYLDEIPGLKGNGIFQLLEGERLKEKIFNYELDLWSY